MSFILDALKKLEQNRKRGEVPDITTVHLHDKKSPKKVVLWPYLLLAALILNAGIFAAWLRPWEENGAMTAESGIQEGEETAQPDQIKADTPAQPVTAKVENITENKDDAVIPAGDDKGNKEIPDNIPEPVDLMEQELPVKSSDEGTIATIGLNPTPEEIGILRDKIKEEQEFTNQMPLEDLAESIEPATMEPEDRGSLINFSQLPDDVRKELPEITINGHIYSDNRSARIANINGFITREGDKVSSGLILEEITTTGVIFSFKEYKFRMRAF
ncbi:MAG: general secretion pathway protein GspB [Nitrospiraceae bacterium]|nr:MAG: general secretion pathway protein GspB [Nitrospiraceae bacterium]